MPFDAVITTDGESYGTLDYFAAPVVTIRLENANSLQHQTDIEVTYTLPAHMLIVKPLFLSGMIFALLVGLLASFRINLSLEDEEKPKKE